MELDFIDISRPRSEQAPVRRRPAPQRRPVNRQAQREAVQKRRAAYRRKRRLLKGVILLLEICFILLLCFLLYRLVRSFSGGESFVQTFSSNREIIRQNKAEKPEMTEEFLTVNPYSRPGIELPKVKNIFVHYTANQGTTAAQNRSYFENLGITGETSASAHFVIGYEGEIIQCIPLQEIAYAVKGRNYDSVSIECCYLSEDGKFTDATYQSLLKLCAWLMREYKLTPDDLRRHYDEGGKLCPLYYAEHEEAWEQLKQDVEETILNTEAVFG